MTMFELGHEKLLCTEPATYPVVHPEPAERGSSGFRRRPHVGARHAVVKGSTMTGYPLLADGAWQHLHRHLYYRHGRRTVRATFHRITRFWGNTLGTHEVVSMHLAVRDRVDRERSQRVLGSTAVGPGRLFHELVEDIMEEQKGAATTFLVDSAAAAPGTTWDASSAPPPCFETTKRREVPMVLRRAVD